MAYPVLIDETRVIACHKAKIPAYIIAKRIGCDVGRIRSILTRNGYDPKLLKAPIYPADLGGRCVHRGYRTGLGD